MASHNFISCINEFTRVTNNIKSCIDHIFIRNIDVLTTQACILKSKVTDHYATLLSFKIPFKSNEGKKNQIKDTHRKININKLTKFIDDEDWFKLLNSII